MYDTVITGEKIGDNGIVFVNLTSGSSNAFDPDMAVAALTNKTGICVDIDSSMNEGCPLEQVATVKDALVGCMDDFAAKFLCGLSVEVCYATRPPPLHTLTNTLMQHNSSRHVQPTATVQLPARSQHCCFGLAFDWLQVFCMRWLP